MAVLYAFELSGLLNTTPLVIKPTTAAAFGGRLRRYRGYIALASQTTSDTIVIAQIPAGSLFAFGVLTNSVSLGTSTIAIGITGSTSKYEAATTFTAVDTPTLIGTAGGQAGNALTAEERIFITIGVASLPASGTLVVDLYFSQV